ncbi:MAG: cyclopropane-fatty-acyl-phospholipid synthase [Bacteroides sp.]|nr:cyclopropane-fatty-acyl-phospholipid synthase [Bacteroides sp.]
MDKDRIIEKISWLTQSKLAPQPITQEYKERQYRFFENYVHFLQNNGLTTREILKEGERATDESQITIGDLTEEGFKFYAFGIRKWREKYDRAKDKDKAINDFAFIEKKLKEFREKEDTLYRERKEGRKEE